MWSSARRAASQALLGGGARVGLCPSIVNGAFAFPSRPSALANGAIAQVWPFAQQSAALSQGLLPPRGLPMRKLAKKWKRRLPNLLDGWDGELPPPSVSNDPKVFAVQQKVFGYRDRSETKTDRKKWERYEKQAEGAVRYVPETIFDMKRAMMAHLKHERRMLKKDMSVPEAEESLETIQGLLDIFRYTPEQERRKKRLLALKRRGKGPPKKGHGKRATKAAGKKK